MLLINEKRLFSLPYRQTRRNQVDHGPASAKRLDSAPDAAAALVDRIVMHPDDLPAEVGRKSWRWLIDVLLLAAALLAAGSAASASQNAMEKAAASPGQVAERQDDLKSLRSQIDTLRKEIASAEGSRRDAMDQLQDAERAISSTQRGLHELTTQIDKLKVKLKDLGSQSRELEQELNAQQAQLEKLLYRQYLRGTPDPLRLFLNGDDPNQLARDLHYLEAIGRARGQILREVEATLQRKQTLVADTRQQAALLSASEARQKEEHAKLLAQRQQRQAMLDRLSDQIMAQRREIGNLQRDEKRLTELVDRLSKIIATRATEARESRREAQRAAPREAHRREVPQPEKSQVKPLRTPPADREKPERAIAPPADEDPAGSAAAPDARAENPPPVAGKLARMKGQLRLPTHGSISNRFGAPRQEGSTWKGLFILASTGSEVRSIAAGRVVFAEWMRGFGNLLIVDHGGSYLSIYANNDSLRKQVGDEVHAGEAIATVGNSGGNPESGLYFELRHQGKPLDPLAWVGPK